VLATQLFRHSCCLIAHKGRIINHPVHTHPIGNDMNVQIVGILMRNGYHLMLLQFLRLDKLTGYFPDLLPIHPCFIFRSDTDFHPQELVPTTTIELIDKAHLFVYSLCRISTKVLNQELILELRFSEDIPQRRLTVRYGFALRYHCI